MRFFLALPFIAILWGCRLAGSVETIELETPLLDDELFSVFSYSWELVYRDSSGILRTENMPVGRRTFRLEVDKGGVEAFCLKARFFSGDTTVFTSTSAGLFYPYDLVTRRGQFRGGTFSWKKGALCELELIASDFLDTDRINWPRIISMARESATGGNMRNLDFRVLSEALLTGEINRYDFRMKRERHVELILPTGTWMNQDPEGSSILSLSAANPTESVLFTGVSRFIHSNGSVLEVYLKEDGSFDSIIY